MKTKSFCWYNLFLKVNLRSPSLILKQAHEFISDMEAAREEVLLELKVRSSERDREMCKEYFQGLDKVIEMFEREIGIFCF